MKKHSEQSTVHAEICAHGDEDHDAGDVGKAAVVRHHPDHPRHHHQPGDGLRQPSDDERATPRPHAGQRHEQRQQRDEDQPSRRDSRKRAGEEDSGDRGQNYVHGKSQGGRRINELGRSADGSSAGPPAARRRYAIGEGFVKDIELMDLWRLDVNGRDEELSNLRSYRLNIRDRFQPDRSKPGTQSIPGDGILVLEQRSVAKRWRPHDSAIEGSAVAKFALEAHSEVPCESRQEFITAFGIKRPIIPMHAVKANEAEIVVIGEGAQFIRVLTDNRNLIESE